jgi:hypothetical protein
MKKRAGAGTGDENDEMSRGKDPDVHPGQGLDPPNLGDTWLTRRQAAAISGVSIRTIDRWLHNPNIGLHIHRPAGGVGGAVRIMRAELEDLLRPTPSELER